jgi:hypothetical protein
MHCHNYIHRRYQPCHNYIHRRYQPCFFRALITLFKKKIIIIIKKSYKSK